MKRAAISVVLSLVLLHSSNSMCSSDEVTPYLPLDHWAYTYIDLLQERGRLEGLPRNVRPYGRSDLLEEVTETLRSVKDLSEVEESWLTLIRGELESLGGKRDENYSVRAEGTVNGNQVRGDSGEEEFDVDYTLGMELSMQFPHGTALHRTVIDHGLFDDPAYRGRRDIDIAAVVEDAYLMIEGWKMTFFAGRARRNLGPSVPGLFLSNNPFPFDHVYFELDFGRVGFNFLTAKLDDIEDPEGGTRFQRYVSMHRLDIRPVENLQVGLFEAVMYGGRGRSLDFAFTNPFSLYVVVENASDKQANSLLGVDAYYRLTEKAGLFGQLLIDDVKLSLFGEPVFFDDEVEPNEFGFIIGGELSDPFGLRDSRARAIYQKITNYTYNSINAFERYTYEDKPLGPPEGNDFDRIALSLLFAPSPELILEGSYARTRKGEGNVLDPFPAEFESSDIPFPSGVVETTDTFLLRARYQSTSFLYVDGSAGFERKGNYMHRAGVTETMPRLDILVGVEWKRAF